jgi:hypothetical protein
LALWEECVFGHVEYQLGCTVCTVMCIQRTMYKLALYTQTSFHFQLDCSPAYKPDQSYQDRFEAAMSTTALPNFIIIIIIISTEYKLPT